MSTDYYLAGPEAKAKVLEWFRLREIGLEAAWKLQEEVGASCVTAAGSRPNGFRFDGKAPDSMRRTRDGAWYPRAKHPEGKEIIKKLKSLPDVPDQFQLSRDLYDGKTEIESVDGRARILSCGAYILGDEVYLEIDEGRSPPRGCTKVKASEFHLAREAELERCALAKVS